MASPYNDMLIAGLVGLGALVVLLGAVLYWRNRQLHQLRRLRERVPDLQYFPRPKPVRDRYRYLRRLRLLPARVPGERDREQGGGETGPGAQTGTDQAVTDEQDISIDGRKVVRFG